MAPAPPAALAKATGVLATRWRVGLREGTSMTVVVQTSAPVDPIQERRLLRLARDGLYRAERVDAIAAPGTVSVRVLPPGPATTTWLVRVPSEGLSYLATLPWVTSIAEAMPWPPGLDVRLMVMLERPPHERAYVAEVVLELDGDLDMARRTALAAVGAILGVVAQGDAGRTRVAASLPLAAILDVAAQPWVVALRRRDDAGAAAANPGCDEHGPVPRPADAASRAKVTGALAAPWGRGTLCRSRVVALYVLLRAPMSLSEERTLRMLGATVAKPMTLAPDSATDSRLGWRKLPLGAPSTRWVALLPAAALPSVAALPWVERIVDGHMSAYDWCLGDDNRRVCHLEYAVAVSGVIAGCLDAARRAELAEMGVTLGPIREGCARETHVDGTVPVGVLDEVEALPWALAVGPIDRFSHEYPYPQGAPD